jgi:hypothetical protein
MRKHIDSAVGDLLAHQDKGRKGRK